MSVLTWAALLYAALTAVSLSVNRHYRDAFDGRPTRLSPRSLRWLGFTGIAVSLIYCLITAPGGRSWVMWCCALTALGYALNTALAYAPRLVPLAGQGALGVALIAGGGWGLVLIV
ncbi:DUF3325 domain-containing protein [Pseudomonas sp. SIMBA_077]